MCCRSAPLFNDKALRPFAASARNSAASISSNAQPISSLTHQHLQVQGLVAEATASSAIAKHGSTVSAAAAAASGVPVAAAAAAVAVQQHYATAIQDYSAAAQLLRSIAASGVQVAPESSSTSSGGGFAFSSSSCSIAKVLLDFGLLFSLLHQQQQESPTGGAAAGPSWPAAAAGIITSAGGLAALTVHNLLAAMAAGGSSSDQASMHIPTVLSALAEHGIKQQMPGSASHSSRSSTAACDAFAGGWQAVPLHMFLPWTSQLLARLGDAEGEVLAGPLEALAAR